VIPKHMESITAKLVEAGAGIEELDDSIVVTGCKSVNKCNFKTLVYPGFPTDMQPQLAVLLCLSDGTSIVTETIFDNRFRYIEELKRLGANAVVDGRVAVIEGVDRLMGTTLKCCDLRAGAALVIAALKADGTSELEEIVHIERGYENFVDKIRGIGGEIEKIHDPSDHASETDILANIG